MVALLPKVNGKRTEAYPIRETIQQNWVYGSWLFSSWSMDIKPLFIYYRILMRNDSDNST